MFGAIRPDVNPGQGIVERGRIRLVKLTERQTPTKTRIAAPVGPGRVDRVVARSHTGDFPVPGFRVVNQIEAIRKFAVALDGLAQGDRNAQVAVEKVHLIDLAELEGFIGVESPFEIGMLDGRHRQRQGRRGNGAEEFLEYLFHDEVS